MPETVTFPLGTPFKTQAKCARTKDGVHRVGLVMTSPHIDHQCLCGAQLWPDGWLVVGDEGSAG